MKRRCRDKNSGNMVECNDTRAAERDQTTWTVQTQPDKYGSYLGSYVKMSESYFKILKMGKNVRKFHFRRRTKMSENGPKKC